MRSAASGGACPRCSPWAIHEIAEIFVDRNYAEKSVEEVEEDHQITIFLILREDLSILPQKDTVLKLNDIIVIRGEQDEKK